MSPENKVHLNFKLFGVYVYIMFFPFTHSYTSLLHITHYY